LISSVQHALAIENENAKLRAELALVPDDACSSRYASSSSISLSSIAQFADACARFPQVDSAGPIETRLQSEWEESEWNIGNGKSLGTCAARLQDAQVQADMPSAKLPACASYPPGPNGEQVTTLMVRNIPKAVNQEALVSMWPASDGIDFLYLPYHAIRRRIAGYCFVNFVSPAAACAFGERWNDKYFPGRETGKRLSVGAADVQGMEANLLHWKKNAWVTNSKYWPVVFRGAQRLDITLVLRELGEDVETQDDDQQI
jgi:hypothetical protein